MAIRPADPPRSAFCRVPSHWLVRQTDRQTVMINELKTATQYNTHSESERERERERERATEVQRHRRVDDVTVSRDR